MSEADAITMTERPAPAEAASAADAKPETNGKPAAKPKPAGGTGKPKPGGTKPKPTTGKPKPAASKPADGKPAAADVGGEYKLNEERIAQIKAYEAEVDELIGESENLRSQSAQLMMEEIDAGASERQVAKAIGKSDSHVHFAVTAWRLLQDTSRGLEDFNAAYKLAKKPAAEREPQPPANSDPDATANPFPKWAAQIRTLNKVCTEMVTQATLPQAKQLDKLLTKYLRDALTRLQDLEGVTGSES